MRFLLPAALVLALAATPGAEGGRQAPPSEVGGFARIDTLVREAIAAGQTPGAVVVVGRGDQTVFQTALGIRSTQPTREPLTLDTVFDLASLTKVVGTTTAVMTLIEDGRLRLNDPVATYVPGFERNGKAGITIKHLLTHVSGLRPDVDLHPWSGYDAAIDLARNETPTAQPGEQFVYSDINFFLLGDIVQRISGQSLDAYLKARVFGPLGMTETGYLPPKTLLPRIAPTERCAEQDAWPCKRPNVEPLRGVVHDPTARRMGGMAGHAGLFSTAHDLQLFARMLLGKGRLGNTRVLSEASVIAMTSRQTPPNLVASRGLGWDIDSQFSSNRGDLFPVGRSYGHTGFTGTSLWIDPTTDSYVIFLSSRLYPDGTGDVTPLRNRVATVAAAALSNLRAPERVKASVLAGIDVLARDGFKPLVGKKVGLITNHTGRARDGRSTIDVLHGAPGVQLVALFSPEHGIRGILDEDVPASRDEKTGLPIHSLYGTTRRPTDAMLAGIDTLVLDLQDVGVRFYTYQTTLAYVMEEAAKRRIPVVVLDRPNPISGERVEGPTSAPSTEFISYFEMPVRHGMTMGELARLFNAERKINAELTVVPLSGWSREQWFDETGLLWINPSPNIRNLNQATLYPGIGAIEYSNISVGRGTDQPFEQIGAPWIDGPRLAEHLNARSIAGIRFYPVTFTPKSSKYANEACQGVFMVVTDRAMLRPVRVGIEIASALSTLFKDRFDLATSARLLGKQESFDRALRGDDPVAIVKSWSEDEARWRIVRAKYLLY